MAFPGGSFGGRKWHAGLSLAVVVAVISADSLSAADRYIVKRDGTKIPIVQSKTELALTYRDGADMAASARRLTQSVAGVLVEDHGSARSRTKLLRVANANARRSRVSADPDVAAVHNVYRYVGVDDALISTGTINVKLRSGLSQAQVEQLWNDYEVEIVRPIEGLHRVYIVKPDVADHDEVVRAELLAGDHRTEWAQPNFRSPFRLREVVPDDQYYNLQWHLNNTGQADGTVDADIDAPEAWEIATGEGVLVGMFDDACDVDHEDLRGNYIGVGHDPTVAPGSEGYDDPRPKDSADASVFGNRHGTAVMGLAVASGNSVGVRGVAYNATFTASRGLNAMLPIPAMSDAEAASVATFALEQGVDVHNNSWGFPTGFTAPAVLLDAIETVFREGRDLDGPLGDGTTNRPPRGMVVVFASGNDGQFLSPGNDLSTLSSAIGVGASNARDKLASYSNFGHEIDIVAPGGDSLGLIATTDNDDNVGYLDWGYNTRGFYCSYPYSCPRVENCFLDPEPVVICIDPDTGATIEHDYVPAIDPGGLYTGTFNGTSAAAPIVTGVAALVLSVNPLLTATDVRLILEHTADKISPADAEYDGVTGRSLRYGYGRVNARRAVEAAQQSLTNGGLTWPERVADATVTPGQLTWLQNGDPLEFLEEDPEGEIENDFPLSTSEFLVLESDTEFEFIPVDGACYDAVQAGCADATTVLTSLPTDVDVKAVGCGLACGADEPVCGVPGSEHCVEFDASTSKKYFAIYARSPIGHYSFGVSADSAGSILDNGALPAGAAAGGGGDAQSVPGPTITIDVRPKEGDSPLTVEFSGNASASEPYEIDDDLTEWDFDINDPTTPNSFQRNTTYEYEVPAGETLVFRARLTMYDTGPLRAGNPGTVETAITVHGPITDTLGDLGVGGDIEIVIVALGGVASTDEENDMCRSVGPLDTCGISPFQVEMRLEGTPRAATVVWDMGDGTTAESLRVTHTYINTTTSAARLPITATLTTRTDEGIDITKTASSRVTILPGTPVVEVPDIVLPGTTPQGGGGAGVGSLCGSAGLLPLFLGMLLLTCLRWSARHR